MNWKLLGASQPKLVFRSFYSSSESAKKISVGTEASEDLKTNDAKTVYLDIVVNPQTGNCAYFNEESLALQIQYFAKNAQEELQAKREKKELLDLLKGGSPQQHAALTRPGECNAGEVICAHDVEQKQAYQPIQTAEAKIADYLEANAAL
jgi:hypothetical protein